jgi:hypothetical protein
MEKVSKGNTIYKTGNRIFHRFIAKRAPPFLVPMPVASRIESQQSLEREFYG